MEDFVVETLSEIDHNLQMILMKHLPITAVNGYKTKWIWTKNSNSTSDGDGYNDSESQSTDDSSSLTEPRLPHQPSFQEPSDLGPLLSKLVSY